MSLVFANFWRELQWFMSMSAAAAWCLLSCMHDSWTMHEHVYGFHAWHYQILMALVVCACKGSCPQHTTTFFVMHEHVSWTMLGMHGVHAFFLHCLAAMYIDCKGCHANRSNMHMFFHSCMLDSWNIKDAWIIFEHAWVSYMTWPSSHGIGCQFLQSFMFTLATTVLSCMMHVSWDTFGMNGVHAAFFLTLTNWHVDCKGSHAHRCNMHVFFPSCTHDSWNMHVSWTIHGQAWVSYMTSPSLHGIGYLCLQGFMLTNWNKCIVMHEGWLMDHALACMVFSRCHMGCQGCHVYSAYCFFLHACILLGACTCMHGVHVTCEFDLTCCNGLQWLMCLSFVENAWWQDLHLIHVSQMQPWHDQVPLLLGTIFCFGEISLLAWVHVHASNMNHCKIWNKHCSHTWLWHRHSSTYVFMIAKLQDMPWFENCICMMLFLQTKNWWKQNCISSQKQFISAKRQVWEICNKDITFFWISNFATQMLQKSQAFFSPIIMFLALYLYIYLMGALINLFGNKNAVATRIAWNFGNTSLEILKHFKQTCGLTKTHQIHANLQLYAYIHVYKDIWTKYVFPSPWPLNRLPGRWEIVVFHGQMEFSRPNGVFTAKWMFSRPNPLEQSVAQKSTAEISRPNVCFHTTRKMQLVYFSFAELGPIQLSKEESWICCLAIRSSLIADVCGGMSQVMSALLKMVLHNEFCYVQDSGIVLKNSTSQLKLLFKLGFFLQDGLAQKTIWSLKGDSGTRFCLYCQNLVTSRSGIEGGVLTSNSFNLASILQSSDKPLQRTIATIAANHATMSPDDCALWQQATGFNFCKQSLPWDQLLGSTLLPREMFTHDWMHTVFVTGVFNIMTQLVMDEIDAFFRVNA